MPELPEVETVRRGLQPVMEDARIDSVETRRPNLRFALPPDLSTRLAGRRIISLGRRAKYLTLEVDGGPMLICHLGMSGSFRIEASGPPATPGTFKTLRSKAAAHDHVVFHLTNRNQERTQVVFNDPRRFGFMLFADDNGEHPMLSGLGVEPTGNALDGALITDLFRGKKAPLKSALLDQRLIAGLGNIYVAESLWRAGLSPRRAAQTLVPASGKISERARRLATSVRAVIADAIEAGGSTLRDYAQADGSLGYFQHQFAVYGREGEACKKVGCNGVVARIVQSGRSTFYCPVCQH